ncbi:MAG: isocitrate lyase/phosphoenolpyruvate mutase family protein [Betaproteobacteria bacterium AqS2]|uniref:Isocitrate lyase/phosphoenolpyruvate mutase family protein n=1 Tax=Candidatus Amphirhobacter heronislandensis TaxID=1732024 RepID=A0A930UDM7_9GAMM|nr:isocitrate lyase/phosphoenolpyruvate mutase family protein [Betaproteobacteria bacterium AqS2]
MKPGKQLRELAAAPGAAPVAGAVSGYAAMLAAKAGLPAAYVSGGATAATKGLPDLGTVAAADVAAVAAEIVAAVPGLPVLVDADTGFGNVLALGRSVKTIEAAGAAGLHIEDQDGSSRRCGHRPGKRLCSTAAMQDRLKAACDARRDDSFVVMARTDAIAPEGLGAAIQRAVAYAEAGADMIFLEGATEAAQYRAAAVANMTEFGVTPLLGRKELAELGVALVLYPLSAFRAMMRAGENLYQALAAEDGQSGALDAMQTRDELYANLGYAAYEQALDASQDEAEA